MANVGAGPLAFLVRPVLLVMLTLRHHRQVLDRVVEWIAIKVMDVEPGWDRSVVVYPDVAMEPAHALLPGACEVHPQLAPFRLGVPTIRVAIEHDLL